MSSRDIYNGWIAKRQALGLLTDAEARRAWEIETFGPTPQPQVQEQKP